MSEPIIISDQLGELKTKQVHLAMEEFTQALVSYKDTIDQHEGIVQTTRYYSDKNKTYKNLLEFKVLYDYSAPVSNQHRLLSAALGVYKIAEDTCIDMFNLSDDKVADTRIPRFAYMVQFQFENGLNKQKLGIPPGNCTISLYKP
jgi:hypothetical protein